MANAIEKERERKEKIEKRELPFHSTDDGFCMIDRLQQKLKKGIFDPKGVQAFCVGGGSVIFLPTKRPIDIEQEDVDMNEFLDNKLIALKQAEEFRAGYYEQLKIALLEKEEEHIEYTGPLCLPGRNYSVFHLTLRNLEDAYRKLMVFDELMVLRTHVESREHFMQMPDDVIYKRKYQKGCYTVGLIWIMAPLVIKDSRPFMVDFDLNGKISYNRMTLKSDRNKTPKEKSGDILIKAKGTSDEACKLIEWLQTIFFLQVSNTGQAVLISDIYNRLIRAKSISENIKGEELVGVECFYTTVDEKRQETKTEYLRSGKKVNCDPPHRVVGPDGEETWVEWLADGDYIEDIIWECSEAKHYNYPTYAKLETETLPAKHSKIICLEHIRKDCRAIFSETKSVSGSYYQKGIIKPVFTAEELAYLNLEYRTEPYKVRTDPVKF